MHVIGKISPSVPASLGSNTSRVSRDMFVEDVRGVTPNLNKVHTCVGQYHQSASDQGFFPGTSAKSSVIFI
jgi:hypothetical protein